MNSSISHTGKRNEFESLVSLLSVAAVVVIIGMLTNLMQSSDLVPDVLPLPSTSKSLQTPISGEALGTEQLHEVKIRFEQAIAMLHAQQYEYAIKALDRVITLAPEMPEAYVNMGFALLGVKEYEKAGNTFNYATELKVDQTNAYWGLALAMEGLEDYEGALGAMRSYIHLSTPDDPFLPRARSALWEWEEKLGRLGKPPASTQQPAMPGHKPHSG